MTANTIIFGPTGGVAGFALRYAASKGAKVTLAMRDPSKTIDGLSASQESSGSFTRVKADLTDASSVESAAKSAQAHSAFIYLIHGTGTPAESIQALKNAGVKHVVFLSSLSVVDPIGDIPPSDAIAFAHAKVEESLHKIYGEGNYAAVRPAYFATNTYQYLGQIKSTGVVRETYPDNRFDFIAPQDIGEVVGALLVRESGPLPRVTELAGPQMVPLQDVLVACAKAAGRDIRIEPIDEETAVTEKMQSGIIEPFAKVLAKMMADVHDGKDTLMHGPRFEKAQGTVKEVLGREPIKVEQWIEENKQSFA